MPRITLGRPSRLAALLGAAVLALALAATASADGPPGRGPSGGPAPTPAPIGEGCAVLRVQLNGSQPATHTCLARTPDGPGTEPSTPETEGIGTSYCWPSSVILFENQYYSGKSICFDGWGTVNLSNYMLRITPWPPFYWTWDDKVSSFSAGGTVRFYEYKDARGAAFTRFATQRQPTMPYGWDNRVSSLCLPNPHQNYYCP
jgi:hypothetical protein